jgi:hypothetical protein
MLPPVPELAAWRPRLGALAHPLDPLGLERDVDDRAWSLDHIMVKLAQLPGMMQLAAGRRAWPGCSSAG